MAAAKGKGAELFLEGEVVDSYSFEADEVPVKVDIIWKKGEFVPSYEAKLAGIGEGTKILLNTMKSELISEVRISAAEIADAKKAAEVREKFEEKAKVLVKKHVPDLDEERAGYLASYLIQHTLELGDIEILMHDDELEEVVINSSTEPLWVYHKKHGWCKTDIKVRNEDAIYDYAAMIGRKIGRQITILSPLMDAHLMTGDRVNATLFPVSSFGNTITIRKFSRNPWTVVRLMQRNSVSPEVAAMIWLCMQNELSLLVSGGTGSGKTSFLNAICCFIPANHRVISIEDTRELTLPSFLQWVPMTTREPNPEGKGEVTMLDLLVNALRQRPDRILVGEVRKQREAEILFEAMHTGHSVYATIHADNAIETVARITNPPINVPKVMLDAIAGIVVQFRHRKLGIRRTLEFAEVVKGGDINVLYRWNVKEDRIRKVGEMGALADTLSLYAGITKKEINEDVAEKVKVLNWMAKNKIEEVNDFGRVVAKYYREPEEVMRAVGSGAVWKRQF